MPNWNCTFQNAGKQMASLKRTYCEHLNLKVTFTNLQIFFSKRFIEQYIVLFLYKKMIIYTKELNFHFNLSLSGLMVA